MTYSVAELLPHGPGFILLDRLVSHDGDAAVCELVIRRDSMFAEASGVPSWAGIEYLAQAIGVVTGLRRRRAGKDIQVGLLLGTRAYKARVPHFAIGSRLTARAEEVVRDSEGVGVFACELRRDGELLATAEIKAFDPDNIGPYLEELRREVA